jgi:hypothetical protein
MHGKNAMIISKNVLQRLDPGVYDILAPWYDFHHDTPVPPAAQASHPLRVFFFEHMGLQVSAPISLIVASNLLLIAQPHPQRPYPRRA